MSHPPKYWAVVPAAGIGRRMGAEVPKQYLPLGRQSVLEYTLDALYGEPRIQAVCVVHGADDPYWSSLQYTAPRPLIEAPGGAERSDSVLNGILNLLTQADPDDWVLVHDAARPCLRREDLAKLIDTLSDDDVGGLLAVPTRDTMKEVDEQGRVVATLDRSVIWHALTPQMFRLRALHDALAKARDAGRAVTDEASAIEAAGLRPKLVEGHADNLKITRPEDLALAGFYLQQQERL
ncbi:2-C-methyl-D-erythritol 4-phosphate cytidylyltransferase [Thiohalobacter thiocyanaticus]|uniref:2-C-methyl-D-erythritol 4-phosphate cytidylyltransferase n=1 Tax=Thiohalobacter thiocyanaticus TaxID=585455 RepID=A0A426QE67_9GAMM|nr:2-C-methyl-D-erythritol 4-phosphate cytidylyltransferase [Thiohalobacter thiocyanaticus]RRQ20037.1 2-C-methyl-D-erythritol 4-phosphate cytidylyltransferase [Thiohalobacter thiocyanaticus]